MYDADFKYPAIIDSGSSQLSVPPHVMKKIRAEWKKAVPGMIVKGISTAFPGKCSSVMNKLKPIAL
jgi:hypothetical protein